MTECLVTRGRVRRAWLGVAGAQRPLQKWTPLLLIVLLALLTPLLLPPAMQMYEWSPPAVVCVKAKK